MLSHRQSLKKSMSGVSGRRKRKEALVSIRKAKKEDGYASRRNMAAAAKADKECVRSEVMRNLGARTQTLVLGLQKSEVETQMKAMAAFHLLMSSGVPSLFDDSDPQYDVLWKSITFSIPYFVKFLDVDDNIQLQSNAAFCLRFIASMDRADVIIQSGALPKLMKLFESGISELQIQAAWCLGNVACEKSNYCEEVLKVCNISQLLPYIHMSSTPALRRASVWLLHSLLEFPRLLESKKLMTLEILHSIYDTLSQLTIHLASEIDVWEEKDFSNASPVAPWRMFEMKTSKLPPNDIAIVRVIKSMNNDMIEVMDVDINFASGENDIYQVSLNDLRPLETIDDEENVDEDDDDELLDICALTMSDTLWSLVSIASDYVNLKEKVDLQFVQGLIKILRGYKSPIVLSPLLRLLGMVVCETDEKLQQAVQFGLLDTMPSILFNPNKSVREDACWMLSNVAGGNEDLVEALVAVPNLLPRLVEQLSWAEWDVRREALWVICNILVRINATILPSIIQLDVLSPLSDFLLEKDPEISLLILEAFESILKKGVNLENGSSIYCIAIEEAECFDKIEDLCYDDNEEVCIAASRILDAFFKDGEEKAQVITGRGMDTDEKNSRNIFSFQPSETNNDFKFNFNQK